MANFQPEASPADPASLPVKILVLGDKAVGKTALIRQLVRDEFTSRYKSTTGVDFALKEIDVDGQTVRLQLWDVAGAETTLGSIAKVYYRDTFGVLLVYDVTRPTTFDTVTAWKREIDDKVALSNDEPVPVVLLGNKCDIETATADTAELDRFCGQWGFVAWFDVSAKTGFNIAEAARCLVTKITSYPDLFEARYKQNAAFRPALAFAEDDQVGSCY
jgi:small GTP-binding protein